MPEIEDRYRPGRIVLGKYELMRPLAEGGMGIVWVARHRALEVDVAVKLTRADGSEESRASQRRALSEARLAAQLEHPAICRVLDFGLTAEGDPCVVTELLRGETLDRVLLLEGKLASVTAVQIILPVLDALTVAHAHGIVHQDVKPSNIFLARDAQQRLQPKLLDFGIARAQREPASWEQVGTISGTPCYMSPEQASGSADIDGRSDLWSVCATLYELLSGAPPFDGQSCASLLGRVLRDEPRPLEGQALDDSELSAIVARGLSKRRDHRWSSAAELALALARWLIARGIDVDVSGQALRGRLPASEQSASAALPATSSGTLVSRRPGAGQSSAWPHPAHLVSRALARGVPRAVTLASGALLVLMTSVSLLKARTGSGAASEEAPALTTVQAATLAAVAPSPSPEAVAATPEAAPPAARTTTKVTDVARVSPEVQQEVTPAATAQMDPAPAPLIENQTRTPTKLGSAPPRVAPARALVRRSENALGYDFGF